MTGRRVGTLLAVFALLCLAVGVFGSASASADHNGKVQLAVGGRGFTAHPSGPLLDTSRLAPGVSISATFGVRSSFDVGTGVSLQLTDVHDDDNGCRPPEARVDDSCGAGQGDLGRALRVTIASAATQSGTYHRVWSGGALQLAKILALGVAVPAKADRWVRVHASVPSTVGNIVESDTFRFGLHVVLAGNGVSGGSDIAGQQAGHTGSSGGHGMLAATGFSAVLFGVGGALLVAAGAVLLTAGRRPRRPTSDGSSTRRREPGPTSPR